MFKVKFVLDGQTMEQDFDKLESQKKGIYCQCGPDSEGTGLSYLLEWNQIISIEQVEEVKDIIGRIKPGTIFTYKSSNSNWAGIKAEDGNMYFFDKQQKVNPEWVEQVYVPVEKLNPK